MALVTQENLDTIMAIRQQVVDVRSGINEINTLLAGVQERIRFENPLNAEVDFSEVVATYQPIYTAALSEFKALAEALPGWSAA